MTVYADSILYVIIPPVLQCRFCVRFFFIILPIIKIT